MNLCSRWVIHLVRVLVKRSHMYGIAESVIRKHHQGIWSLTTTIGSNTIFANNGITQFVQMLTLIVTSTESLNAVRNIKSHKVMQQSFGQLLRYLVLFIVYRYYTNRVCIQWIQQGWFYKDLLAGFISRFDFLDLWQTA